MALTGFDRGTGAPAVSGATSFTLAPASNCTAGALVILVVACDNAHQSGTAFTTFTCTDNVGGTVTWTRRQSPLYDPGAASAGIAGAIFERPVSAGQLLTTSTVTVSFGSDSVAAKAWTIMEVTGSVGTPTYLTGNTVAAHAYAPDDGSHNTATMTTTGNVAVEIGDMIIGAVHAENTTSSADPWVGDADTTNGSWSTMQHNGVGAALTGVSVGSQRKIVTATGNQVFNPTASVGTPDCVLSYVIIHEAVSLTDGPATEDASSTAATDSTVIWLGGLTEAASASDTPNFAATDWGGGIAEVASNEDTPDASVTSGATRMYVSWAQTEMPVSPGVASEAASAADAPDAGISYAAVGVTEDASAVELSSTGEVAIEIATADASTDATAVFASIIAEAASGSDGPDASVTSPGSARMYLSWAQMEMPEWLAAVAEVASATATTDAITGRRMYLSWAQMEMPVSPANPSVAEVANATATAGAAINAIASASESASASASATSAASTSLAMVLTWVQLFEIASIGQRSETVAATAVQGAIAAFVADGVELATAASDSDANVNGTIYAADIAEAASASTTAAAAADYLAAGTSAAGATDSPSFVQVHSAEASEAADAVAASAASIGVISLFGEPTARLWAGAINWRLGSQRASGSARLGSRLASQRTVRFGSRTGAP